MTPKLKTNTMHLLKDYVTALLQSHEPSVFQYVWGKSEVWGDVEITVK